MHFKVFPASGVLPSYPQSPAVDHPARKSARHRRVLLGLGILAAGVALFGAAAALAFVDFAFLFDPGRPDLPYDLAPLLGIAGMALIALGAVQSLRGAIKHEDEQG